MRYLSSILLLLTVSSVHAHEVSGTVEVILKGEKRKTDLSSVIVYLDSVQKENNDIPPEILTKRFVMMTRNKQLSPRAMAVPVGVSVDFPNYDAIFHNLFSVSAPNNFDLGLYKGGASKSKVFEHPGIVKVFCNVHPHMSATIVVSASPYYAAADKSGNFSFGTIPNGTYQLRAYTEEGQTSQLIQVGMSPLTVKLSIDGRNFKKLRHKNKFGKDYSTNENEKY